ncbi:hypothetical protein TNCV_1175061 [Trichonephila clavipes]|nr:hypothetical protein TNCV_1175061 [Trichonephila clavipes]
MENTTFAMPNIIDSHDMGLRTVYSPDAQKKTHIQLYGDGDRMNPTVRSQFVSRVVGDTIAEGRVLHAH